MKIHLHTPCIIEVIRVTKDCFGMRIGIGHASSELVVFSPITDLDIRLRIDVTV